MHHSTYRHYTAKITQTNTIKITQEDHVVSQYHKTPPNTKRLVLVKGQQQQHIRYRDYWIYGTTLTPIRQTAYFQPDPLFALHASHDIAHTKNLYNAFCSLIPAAA